MSATVVVGRILSSWGIKGEVKVLPFTDSPDRFSEITQVIVLIEGLERVLTIENYWIQGRHIIIKFSEINTPEDAALYKGHDILIPEEQTKPLPEGTYYHYQIIGLPVYTIDNRYLGVVDSIIETGSNDVYVIKNRKEYLIPAIEEVIKEINLEKKRIVIKPIEGLLE